MTISSTTRTAGPFTGNGTASAFAFAFKVFSAGDLAVYRTATATGVVTTLALTTDYTVTLTDTGGTVTLTGGNLATGQQLLIVSAVPQTQSVDLTNQGGFYPEVINDALDRATVQVQQVQVQANRSIRFPPTETGISAELPKASDRANQYLAFGADGSVDIGGAVPDQRYYGAKTSDPATRNDGTARVAGDLYFNSVANTMKVFNGSAWNTVTTTPVDGDKGDITLSAGASTYTIDNDAVTTAKILNANVTAAKLATNSVETAKIVDLNVTTGKIDNLAVTTGKIANGAVTSAKLANNIDIAGTLDVTGVATFDSTSTFSGAPSYAADPGSANVLSRKSYVDSVTRVGATKIVKVNASNNGIDSETGGITFSITGSRFRCAAGQTWEGTRMDVFEVYRTVTSSSDSASTTATVANAVYIFVRTA